MPQLSTIWLRPALIPFEPLKLSQLYNMPTPESELFKSQKPTVAPTFNGVDFDDTKAFKAAEDAIIREQWVGAMMTRIIGEELGKCYFREGVNHLENCGHLRGEFGGSTRMDIHLTSWRKQKKNAHCLNRKIPAIAVGEQDQGNQVYPAELSGEEGPGV